MNFRKGALFMGLLTFISGILSGCSGPSLEHYKGAQPQLSLEEYFTGPIKAWGLVQDYSGKVTRRFDVDMVGTWKEDENGNLVGTLEEDFRYYDGKSDKRIWTITKEADGQYVGKAGDILEQADGVTSGNAMRWAYRMDLPVGDKTYRLTFDDWMFLMNDGILINRSYLKKFGFTVAELTLFMQKQ